MSRENLELVVRASRAAIRRPKPDFETVNALYHPDHVLVSVMATKLGEGEAVGARGYKAWLEEQEGVMPVGEQELEGAVDIAPDTVLTVTSIRFRGASSGAGAEQRLWGVVTVADGKITRTAVYTDPVEALEAVTQRTG
jgi:ketosteroid isomerase-like protein